MAGIAKGIEKKDNADTGSAVSNESICDQILLDGCCCPTSLKNDLQKKKRTSPENTLVTGNSLQLMFSFQLVLCFLNTLMKSFFAFSAPLREINPFFSKGDISRKGAEDAKWGQENIRKLKKQSS